MELNMKEMERKISKIIQNNQPGNDMIEQLRDVWDDAIQQIYDDDGVHDLNWFEELISNNNADGREHQRNKNPQTIANNQKFLDACDEIMQICCTDEVDVEALLKAIEKGGSFDINESKNYHTPLDYVTSCDQFVQASLMYVLGEGGNATFPSSAQVFKNNSTMLFSMQADPRLFKMMLAFFPNTCLNPANQKQIQQEIKSYKTTDFISQNLKMYEQFIKGKKQQSQKAAEAIENRNFSSQFYSTSNQFDEYGADAKYYDHVITEEDIVGENNDNLSIGKDNKLDDSEIVVIPTEENAETILENIKNRKAEEEEEEELNKKSDGLVMNF